MALDSPGVEVQVIDESFYTPAAPGTVPLILVTSAQDKINPSGSTAEGTLAANAGKVYVITSQRDLVDTFGTPLFYTDNSGNPQHGNELNEYGLQAAYSVLGLTSRAYVVRADLDLDALVPSSTVPTSPPDSGTYWVDTDESTYGVKVWNSSTLKFSNVTPIVFDEDSGDDVVAGVPNDSVGERGDFGVVHYPLGNDSDHFKLWYKTTSNTWVLVEDTFDGGKSFVTSPHYEFPTFNGTTLTGSVWINTTTPNNGAKFSVKVWNGDTASWSPVNAPIFTNRSEAIFALDPNGGGQNIAVGSVIVFSRYDLVGTSEFTIKRRNATGATTVVTPATVANAVGTYTMTISETRIGEDTFFPATITFTKASTATYVAQDFVAEINSSSLTNITASYSTVTNKLTLTHSKGGDILLEDTGMELLNALGWTTGYTNTANLYPRTATSFVASNWKPLVFQAKAIAPTTTAVDGTMWYSSIIDQVDIMVHDGTTWVGYQNYDHGNGTGTTDPNGPIISATEPVDGDRSDGEDLADGDIWISTANLERYGKDVYVYNTVDGWVSQDVTDQSTPDGWLFADARWATTGDTLTASSIEDLLTSDYLDPDAPDPAQYPKGMKLWNTRRSGFNVKKFISGYINLNANNGTNIRYNDEDMSGYIADRWVSQYSRNEDGSGNFGRMAQRAQTVNALKELIDSNSAIRDTDTLIFNLLAAPGYPEAIQNLIGLNTDRGLTAFVIGDTPFRLAANATALSNWGNNTNLAFDNGDVGATSFDEYMAMYYPSGFTNDNTGNNIVVPPSHMMLRTFINSDAKSYQWFAPAGTRRGTIDNASSVGYIDGEGEFRTVSLSQGIRDTLDNVKINPIANLSGIGLVAYGQRTRARNASALDRINVARLVVYLRRQLDLLARPFLFEPNDAQTRREIKAAAENLMLELVGQRALYDFIVVCDETNNTPRRIDNNELYMDIAIEPVKAVEFIYIPLRIKNTGDIQAGL